MVMPVIGAALSNPGFWGAVGSLAGGIFGSKSRNDAMESQVQQQINLQKEMAQSGVQWRVEDAKKAGVHPLFALGAQLPAASPISIFEPSSAWDQMGPMMHQLGQAYVASRQEHGEHMNVGEQYPVLWPVIDQETGEEYSEVRMMPFERVQRMQAVKQGDLELELLQAQINNLNRPPASAEVIGPGAWEFKRPQVTAPNADFPYLSAGPMRPFGAVFDTPFGPLLLPDAQNAAEALESLESVGTMGLVVGANLSHFGVAGVERLKRAKPSMSSIIDRLAAEYMESIQGLFK